VPSSVPRVGGSAWSFLSAEFKLGLDRFTPFAPFHRLLCGYLCGQGLVVDDVQVGGGDRVKLRVPGKPAQLGAAASRTAGEAANSDSVLVARPQVAVDVERR
jgi:hypothetical protein